MEKLYLTLYTTNDIPNALHRLIFSREFPIVEESGEVALQRTSPVFCIDDNPCIDYLNFKSSKILLLYTLDSYNVISTIKSQQKKVKNFDIFITQGVSSVFLLGDFSLNTDSIVEALKSKNVNIIGTELWEVSKGEIKTYSCHLPKYNRKKKVLSIDESRLAIDDVFLFQELVSAYNHFDLLCTTYVSQYEKLSDSIRYSITEMYERMCDIVINKKLGSIDDSILREEVLETTATLKTVNVQAFNGIGILSSNLARSGRYSLFGMGLCYAGMYQLYEFCREKFQQLLPTAEKLKKFLDTTKSPIQENLKNFNEWRNAINKKNIANIDNLYNPSNHRNTNEHLHLTYFSHRYGFREAKKTISIAKQSISLSILPTWGLNTFFHELLHSHVRVLLSELDLIDSQSILNSISDNEITIYSNNAESLKQFLQIAIFDCIKNYCCIKDRQGKIQSVLSSNVLLEGLRECFNSINEMMVHTLDFHYFYSSDPDLYIKSIWISWLKLPATDGRIPEYLLRTICAVGTFDLDIKLDNVFDLALNKIQINIKDLKECDLCIDSQIDMVLKCIEDIRNNDEIKKEYIDVWGRIAYITCKFLYSKKIQASFEYSLEADSQNLEDYTLNFKTGEYNSIKYKNPIKIIQQVLTLFFEDCAKHNYTSNSVEIDSLWIYNILSSTKFNNDG
jgi:hypothetical protein